jgi:hypothetical protein
MKMIDGLLAELEQEANTTRRVLERIPQAHLSWKPHPKSMSLGQLALHVATVPGNVAQLAAVDTIPEPPTFVQPEATTTSELVPALTESVANARQLLGGFDDAKMGATWRLQSGGRRSWPCHASPLFAPSCSTTGITTVVSCSCIFACSINRSRRYMVRRPTRIHSRLDGLGFSAT